MAATVQRQAPSIMDNSPRQIREALEQSDDWADFDILELERLTDKRYVWREELSQFRGRLCTYLTFNDSTHQMPRVAGNDDHAAVRGAQGAQVLRGDDAELADAARGQLQPEPVPQLDARGRRPPRLRLLPRPATSEGVLRRARRGGLPRRRRRSRCQSSRQKQVGPMKVCRF